MKLVNQLLCGVHIAAAEALAFAEALGLTAECWQMLGEGAAASFMLDDRGPEWSRASSSRRAARWTSS
jgi:3-hydroxyisobutyrate dehydrogenase